jgi:hypothetical protein
MKKENNFLAVTFILPVIFVLTMWGYYSYYSGKLNPQYDFVYIAPYNNPYFGYNGSKQTIYNPFEIQDSGQIKIVECSVPAISVTSDYTTIDNTINYQSPTQNNCSSIVPKELTYYRFDTKAKTSKQIDFDTFKSTKYNKGFESVDGYTFKGDINSQLEFGSTYSNPFTFNAAKFSNATLTNKNGANVSFELKENPYNRLFVGWIKN